MVTCWGQMWYGLKEVTGLLDSAPMQRPRVNNVGNLAVWKIWLYEHLERMSGTFFEWGAPLNSQEQVTAWREINSWWVGWGGSQGRWLMAGKLITLIISTTVHGQYTWSISTWQVSYGNLRNRVVYGDMIDMSSVLGVRKWLNLSAIGHEVDIVFKMGF